MRLFADPPGFEGRGEPLEGGVGRQVRHVELLLSRWPALADQPDLIAGHGLDTIVAHAMPMSVANPNTACCKQACQPSLGSPPPADLPPCLPGQHRLSRDGDLIRNVVLASLSDLRDGEHQLDVGWIDVLVPWQP